MSTLVNIHATCVRLERAARAFDAPSGAGVLLLGKSGSGKSDLALRLIGRGARLVADDRTELRCERGRLVARAPAKIAGLIELRGVGIVAMPRALSAPIALVVDLSGMVNRLPARQHYSPPKPLRLSPKERPALIALCAFDASAPEKIIATVSALHNNALRNAVKSN
jgi:hypothetical protein